MKCKCGKKFECNHRFNLTEEVFLNHCMYCGKGAEMDMCKGMCKDCHQLETWAWMSKAAKYMEKDRDKKCKPL